MTQSHNLEKNLDFVSESGEERLASFLSLYGKQLLITVAVLLLCLVGAYVWHRVGQGHAETDYSNAEKSYQELLQVKGQDRSKPLAENESYLILQGILARRPDLESRYDGPLAQIALERGDLKLAALYADKALKQLMAENLPFYEEFSKTSLLISEGNDREAYKRASFLQKRMREEAQSVNAGFRQSLLVFNQIRIASLMQRLGMRSDELQAWQEVQQLAAAEAANSGDRPAANLLETLKTGQVTFEDYLRAREKALRI